MNILIRGMNSSMTNMTNVHTYAIGSVNLITTMILILDCQLCQFSYDVMCGTRAVYQMVSTVYELVAAATSFGSGT